MDLGFAAVNNPEEWGDESPAIKVVENQDAPTSSQVSAHAAAVQSANAAAVVAKAVSMPAVEQGPPPGKMHNDTRTRYFIIKCNSHKNLVSSIQNNVWATQKHNEVKLNEAFRIAPYVILLFSVNTSGSFQGYARMVARTGESQVPDPFNGFGALFDIKWLKLHDLDFNDVAHVTNEWNNGLSVKISRDGQELPNRVGKTICDLIDRGVYKADPDTFVQDNEVPNPVPDDALPEGTPLPDNFRPGGKYGDNNWSGKGGGKWGDRQKGGSGKGGYNSGYGRDNNWGSSSRSGPYSGFNRGGSSSSNYNGSYNGGGGGGAYHQGSTSTWTTTNAHQGGASHLPPGSTVIVTSTGPSAAATTSNTNPQSAISASWGNTTPSAATSGSAWGQSSTTTNTHPSNSNNIWSTHGSTGIHADSHSVQRVSPMQVVQVAASPAAAPAGHANITYMALGGAPTGTTYRVVSSGGNASPALQSAPTSGSPQPDFVNMSYDQYQKWYAQHAAQTAADEGDSSDSSSGEEQRTRKKKKTKKSKTSSQVGPVWVPPVK